MHDFQLILGNKNYSSWSLRPWLVMKHIGVPFKETLIPLDEPTSHEDILAISPSGRVPALKAGEMTIWDSLAICEYLNETFPQKNLWPKDPAERAFARSISNEMHSGFSDLRNHMPMNIRRSSPGKGRTPAVEKDIHRILEIWTHCRRHFGKSGEMLFGSFTIADAMFAPVATRFKTYSVELPAVCEKYMESVFELPAMQEWVKAAREEKWSIKHSDL